MNLKKIKGIIRSYNTERKFGFIESYENEKSYFFHVSSLLSSFKIEPNCTEVLFFPTENKKGLAAVSIEEYFVEIGGQFSKIPLKNIEKVLTNNERILFLEEQKKKINELLKRLSDCGITTKSQNDWLSLDTSIILALPEPNYPNGHIINEVPSGYRQTAKHLLSLLQNQINDFNIDYVGTSKGIDGEKRTLQSLKSLTLDYHILNNVRFELSTNTSKYSSESDVIVITDRAVFIIETKNFGGKGDTIEVTSDGRWTIMDNYTQKSRLLKNPFKQSTDHIFALRKFFKESGIDLALPIVPIVAIANDAVSLKIPDTNEAASIIRVDMLGSCILNYIDKHPAQIGVSELSEINKKLSDANLPPKEYIVIDYYKNIETICKYISKMFEYWMEDETASQQKTGKDKFLEVLSVVSKILESITLKY